MAKGGDAVEVDVEIDDASPPEAAEKASDYLAAKPRQDNGATLALSVLAGVFIAFGGLIFLATGAGAEGYSGGQNLAAAIGFSVGLILCIVAGAELFTGNTMLVVSGAEGRLGTGAILRFWALVWFGNLVGSLLVAALFVLAAGHMAGDGAVGANALSVGDTKMAKGVVATFCSGILANMLVCLAVWASQAARSVQGKVLAIVGPVAGFVVLGLEHSVANMSLLPTALMIERFAAPEFWQAAGIAAADYPTVGFANLLVNLAVSTLGNIAGGAAIGLTYWYSFLRED